MVVHSDESRNGPSAFQGFDPATGKVRWRREFQRRPQWPIHTVAVGDSIVFAFDDQYVHAVRAADGALERFTFPVQHRDQRIWLTASGLDAWFGFGTHVWRWPAGRSQPEEAVALSKDAASPEHAAAIGTWLFLGGGKPAWMRAFDLTTGHMRWERATLSRIATISADERLYLNIWRRQFELIAVNVNTGQELWTAGAGGFAPPATQDEWLYANGWRSALVVDPITGRIARTIKAEAEVMTTPVRAGDLLLFGTINGALHAVRVGDLKRSGGD